MKNESIVILMMLDKYQKDIDDITEYLYSCITNNGELEFLTAYQSYKELTKLWSKYSKCGYVNPEIEEYKIQLNYKY